MDQWSFVSGISIPESEILKSGRRRSHVGDIALGALDIALEGRVPGGGEAEHPTPRPTERKWPWSRGRGGGITCNIIAMHG